MTPFVSSLLVVAGICTGFGIIYLFLGLRRSTERRLHLLFAGFALCYAASVAIAASGYTLVSPSDYFRNNQALTVINIVVFLFLIWFVRLFTGVQARLFTRLLTLILLAIGLVTLFRPELSVGYTDQMYQITLPWGEQVTAAAETDAPLLPVLVVAQLVIIGFVVFASVQQYRHEDRREAVILLAGMAWFICTLIVTILVQAGTINFVYLSDYGFLGPALAMSFVMANRAVRTEEELSRLQSDLSEMVVVRTQELHATQAELVAQAEETAVAAERNRLARDLHDIVTQILFSINLIAMSLPRLWKQDPPMAEQNTEELLRLSRGAMAEMRVLLRELRPQTILATDLGTLLTQLCESLSARHDIPTEIDADTSCAVPPDIHVALYRIAQEAMNNVAKHAEPNRVTMLLSCGAETVRMEIGDDGIGFDPVQTESGGMGLNIMRERATDLGIQLDICSIPSAGTTITAIWPVAPSIEANHDV